MENAAETVLTVRRITGTDTEGGITVITILKAVNSEEMEVYK